MAKIAPVEEARQRVHDFPGMIPNGPADSGWFRWEVPEGGTLYCDVSENGFSTDHSPWEAVLEFYVYLKDSYPDLVILDPQEGAIFDEESFRRFLKSPEDAVPRSPKPQQQKPLPDTLEKPERSFAEAVLDLNRTDPDTGERMSEVCREAHEDLKTYFALGEPCLDDFIDAFAHEDHMVRNYAFQAVGSLGSKAVDAVPALVRALEQPELQMYAATAIGELGETARPAVPAIVEVLERSLAPGHQAGDTGTTLLTLEKLGPLAAEAVPVASRYLHHPEAHIRVFAGRALIGMGHGKDFAAVAVRLLRETCQNYSAGWHSAVTRLIGQLGTAAQSLVPDLCEMLTDDDPIVRLTGTLALEEAGAYAAAAVPTLIQVLSDPNERVRRHAIRCLTTIGSSAEQAMSALRRCEADPDREVRRLAKEAIEALSANG